MFGDRAKLQTTGAYRVSSADLGRNYEEDLSIHPNGIRDFGPEKNLTPIDVVMEFGGAPSPQAAAHTLCEWLGRKPDAFGWEERTTGEPEPPEPPKDRWQDGIILSPGAPLISARSFIQHSHMRYGLRTLQHQNDTFYSWSRTNYADVAQEEMRAQLYGFLNNAKRPVGKGETAPFNPNKSKVANVLEATAAETQLPCSTSPPAWLDTEQHPAADEVIACTNGLLHLPTREVIPHTPAFFGLNALPFAYDPDPPEPEDWLTFLAQLWPEDPEAIDTLQEMFGLLLTGDTRHQKAFLIVGPKRSGKGTIARVLTKLLGQDSVCGPTLSGLAGNFGLAPLIGKRLAIISDARISGKADQGIIVERILSVTGEDSLTVDRKFKEGWTGRLQTRFLLLTNELPRLTDSSGALASRFVIMVLTRSFFGQEDHGLTDRLVNELPGILAWSIAGWDRLQERGCFLTPASSAGAQQELDDLGSPIGAFIRDHCIVDARRAIDCGRLFDGWCAWCRDNNRDRPGTTQVFGRDLRAVVPGLTIVRPRNHDGTEGRNRHYQGVDLTSTINPQVGRDGPRSL